MAHHPSTFARIEQDGQHHDQVPAQTAREDKRKEAEETIEPAVMREVVDGQEDLSIQGIQWLHAFQHGLAQVFSLLWMPIPWRALLIGIKRLLGGLSQGCSFAAGAGGDLLGCLGNPIGGLFPRRGAFRCLFNSLA